MRKDKHGFRIMDSRTTVFLDAMRNFLRWHPDKAQRDIKRMNKALNWSTDKFLAQMQRTEDWK